MNFRQLIQRSTILFALAVLPAASAAAQDIKLPEVIAGGAGSHLLRPGACGNTRRETSCAHGLRAPLLELVRELERGDQTNEHRGACHEPQRANTQKIELPSDTTPCDGTPGADDPRQPVQSTKCHAAPTDESAGDIAIRASVLGKDPFGLFGRCAAHGWMQAHRD